MGHELPLYCPAGVLACCVIFIIWLVHFLRKECSCGAGTKYCEVVEVKDRKNCSMKDGR